MFANPDPNEDPDGSRFEAYDLKMLIGYGLIGWALALSQALGRFLP